MIFRSLGDLETSTTALARLARTCRLFSAPALDILWSRLPSIGPLLRLLSEDKWINEYDDGDKTCIVVRRA